MSLCTESLVVSANAKRMRSAKDRAADFRKWAAECLEVAERMSLKDEKARLIATAEHWLELARRAEAESEAADDPPKNPTKD